MCHTNGLHRRNCLSRHQNLCKTKMLQKQLVFDEKGNSKFARVDVRQSCQKELQRKGKEKTGSLWVDLSKVNISKVG